MFETSFISNAAVSHGKTYETVALKKFSEVTELQASPCGFFVCPDYSFLGCSPDAVIDEESIIEIKCPFNGRNCFDCKYLEILNGNVIFKYLAI